MASSRPWEVWGSVPSAYRCGFTSLPVDDLYGSSVPVGTDYGSAQIPVFASVPSKLDDRQSASKAYIYQRLRALGLEPRTVGGPDPGIYNPLHEVRTLARHCAGGIILGYSQVSAELAKGLTTERGSDGSLLIVETVIREYRAPTPWNQLETGILFGLGLPLFVLKQENITGGIFDEGASDVLVHNMPMPGPAWKKSSRDLANPSAEKNFDVALLRWQALVRTCYYGPPTSAF